MTLSSCQLAWIVVMRPTDLMKTPNCHFRGLVWPLSTQAHTFPTCFGDAGNDVRRKFIQFSIFIRTNQCTYVRLWGYNYGNVGCLDQVVHRMSSGIALSMHLECYPDHILSIWTWNSKSIDRVLFRLSGLNIFVTSNIRTYMVCTDYDGKALNTNFTGIKLWKDWRIFLIRIIAIE